MLNASGSWWYFVDKIKLLGINSSHSLMYVIFFLSLLSFITRINEYLRKCSVSNSLDEQNIIQRVENVVMRGNERRVRSDSIKVFIE